MAATPAQTPGGPPGPDRPDGWWAWPAAYAVAVYLLGFLPHLAWWAAPTIGVMLAALGKVLARHAFHPVTHGDTFSWWAQALGVLAGLAAGTWLAVAREVGGPLAAWPWLAYGTAGLGAGHLLLMWIAPSAERAHAERPATDYTTAGSEVALQVLYRGVLARAGSDDVQVTDVTVSPSGGVETVHLTPVPVAPGERRRTVNRDQFTGRLPHLVVELDQTLRRRAPNPVRIDDQDVHIEHGAGGSEWLMHVTVARPLDVTQHFVPADAPQPWCGPKRCGRYEDDKPLYITFCDEREGGADGEFVGMKGSGKTGSMNVKVARSLESDQGEVWLIGTNKLVKVARPWLEPWLRGETDRPVIDWVAGEDTQACLRALDSAFKYAIECNRRTRGNAARKPVRGRGALRIFIDESSDLQERSDTIVCCDGKRRNASQLISAIQKIGRSAPVEIWKANQDALFDSFGTDGNKQRRNLGIGIAGKCKTPQDAQRVIPGLPRADPTKLRNQAVFVEQLYDEPREVRARFDFIEDDQIPALAARYTPWRFGLDPAITAHMPYYADRWDAQWHQVLVREIEAEGLSWPGVPATAHTETAEPEPEQEAPVVDMPSVDVPDDYHDPDFDVWALFERDAAGPDQPTDDTAPRSTLANPDPSQMVAGFRRMAEWVRQQEAHQGADIPDPLGIVIALLDLRGAPREWVTTETLAIASQRVAPDAEPEERRKAIERFGLELSRQTGLKTEQLPRPLDPQRRRGYRVQDLREAAQRLSRGG